MSQTQRLNESLIKEARNILILGHRFAGKTTLIKKLIEPYSDTIIMYNHLECGIKEYPEKNVVLYTDEALLNDIPRDCVVLDDILYTKEMTKFNKKMWLNLFTSDQTNKSIISTQVFDAFSEEQKQYIDLVFIYKKALNTCDIMNIFNQYIRIFPDFQESTSFKNFHEIIKSLGLYTSLVLNLNTKKMYIYDISQISSDPVSIFSSITDKLLYFPKKLKALVI
jgi:predicted AAA+ superfamily ATPase